MVCLGPSKGCRRCKTRKVKCDMTKPSCQRCIKAESACTGNEAFRDQTQMVKKKVDAQEHTHRNTQPNYTSKVKHTRKTEYFQKEDRPYINYVSAQPMHTSLSQCPEQQSLCFYISYLLPLLPGYYTDEIPDILANSSDSLVLSTITQATALNFMALLPQYAHYRVLAVSRYAEALRSVRQAITDPVAGKSDTLLLAILMLGTWEHSRSLNSESSQMSSHLIGAIAMIRNRIQQRSKHSKLFLRLFRFVRAALIYHCIEHGKNQPLDSFSACIVDSDLSGMYAAVEDTADNGFCGLAEFACNVPQLLHRVTLFLECANRLPKSVAISKAAEILDDLKGEEKRLVSWPSSAGRHHPEKAHSTPKKQIESLQERNSNSPCRMDVYVSAPLAASCNAWRLCRILVLDSIAKVAQMLASVDTTTQSWPEYTLEARSRIRELVDDICASVQVYLGENNEDKHCKRREVQGQQNLTEEELVANWSQMKRILSKGSELDCVPARQSEWMSNYVKMLSGEKSRSAWIGAMPSMTVC